jgi:hypothetical protein
VHNRSMRTETGVLVATIGRRLIPAGLLFVPHQPPLAPMRFPPVGLEFPCAVAVQRLQYADARQHEPAAAGLCSVEQLLDRDLPYLRDPVLPLGDVGRGVSGRHEFPAVGEGDRIVELAGPFRSANGATLLCRIRHAYRSVAAGIPGRSGYSARKAFQRLHSRRLGRRPKASPGGFHTLQWPQVMMPSAPATASS